VLMSWRAMMTFDSRNEGSQCVSMTWRAMMTFAARNKGSQCVLMTWRAISARPYNLVLLENANLCSPTVLDRLNPLLEIGGMVWQFISATCRSYLQRHPPRLRPSFLELNGGDVASIICLALIGGTLLVSECGMRDGEPRVITAHPGFRLFLALDPRRGDVSRAMRNRGVEVFLMPSEGGAAHAKIGKELALLPPVDDDDDVDGVVELAVPVATGSGSAGASANAPEVALALPSPLALPPARHTAVWLTYFTLPLEQSVLIHAQLDQSSSSIVYRYSTDVR